MSFRHGSSRICCGRILNNSVFFNGKQTTRLAVGWKQCRSVATASTAENVLFPGALNSKFTNDMKFIRPATHEAIPTYRVMDSDGKVLDAEIGVDTEDALALELYHNMVQLNIMDNIMYMAQRQGPVSFYMISAGEEGISIGSASALDPGDSIFLQYREAGVFMQRGFTIEQFMNQLCANKQDSGLGRNMPVHYGSKELNIQTISSTLATQIPHAAGSAYALKLQNQWNPEKPPRVTVCYFGEGAASEGDFHGALNIAATRQCPVIFICRNNGYAISTPTSDQYRGDGIASRGVGYGIDAIRVDGNDIFAVRRATKEARRRALEDGGRPVLIEMMAYRVGSHSTSDEASAYRAKRDVEHWERRDNPITRLRKWLEHRELWDEEKERKLQHTLTQKVKDAFKKAKFEGKPSLANAFEGVYENLTEEQKLHIAELKDTLERYPKEYDLDKFEGGIESLTKLLEKK